MADPQAARIARLEEVLRQVPDQYQSKDRLRDDVTALLHTVHTLQAQLQAFEGSGRKVTLFYLFGVLPITYRNSIYHIPITIYFDPPYPRQPPRCFVTPTAGMELKESHPHVDRGGFIHVPYLSDWNERTSTLGDLAGVLTAAFTARPPVQSTTGKASRSSSASRRQAVTTPGAQTPGQTHHRRLSDSGRGVCEFPILREISQSLSSLFGGAEQSAPEATPPPLPPQPPPQPFKLPKHAQPALHEKPSERRTPLRTNSRTPSLSPLCRRGRGDEIGALVVYAERGGRVEKELRAAEAALREFVARYVGHELDPDQLPGKADPDCQQVLDLLAEELALDDLLIALDELLAARKISLDVFLAEVRDVSRRQFQCRALRQKTAVAIAAAWSERDPGPRGRMLKMGA